jgi:Tetratricopeptide repeat
MKRLAVFFVFGLLGLLVYADGLGNKFIIDDYFYLNNPVLSQTKYIFAQWDPYREEALGVVDKTGALPYYRPMAQMLWNFCYTVFKGHFWQYHALNICLYVLACFFIYLLIEKLTSDGFWAFLTGLFYLVHPINGIAVNYILGNAFSLEVIFMSATIILLDRFRETGGRRQYYYLSLACCLLSLFWHEAGFMITFYAAAYVLLFAKGRLSQKMLILVPYFFVAFCFLVFRMNFSDINDSFLQNARSLHLTTGQYLAGIFRLDGWYISRLFCPEGIVMQFSEPVIREHILGGIAGFFLLPALFLFLYRRFSRVKACQLGLLWFLMGLVPVFLAAFRKPENGLTIEPQWFVFSSLGFFILAAYGCTIIFRKAPRTGMIMASVLVIAWGTITYADNQLWSDQKTYVQYWLHQVPNAKTVRLYLAESELRAGDLKDAQPNLRMALSGRLSDAIIYCDFGIIERANGRLERAEAMYLKALKIYPYLSMAYNNLGSLYAAEGRWGLAQENFSQALIFDPLMTKARAGLALIPGRR